MSTEVTDVLRTTDLLGSASAADLEALVAASRSRIFRRGQIRFDDVAAELVAEKGGER